MAPPVVDPARLPQTPPRQGTHTAAMFGVHEKSVRNYRDEIVRLLASHGCQPPGATRSIRTLDDLRAHLDALADETVIVDGTHVPRAMPVDWDGQRAAFNGRTATTSPRAP